MDSITPFLAEAERYLMQNDLDRAAACYAEAVRLDQNRSPLPMTGMARIALFCQRPADASALLDRVLERHPQCAEAFAFRGLAEEMLGNTKAAHRFLSRAVALNPRFSPAQFSLGRVCGQLGRWDEALAALRVARELEPDQSAVVVILATAAVRAGKLGEALAALTTHLARSPNDVDALVALADVLVETRKLELAADLLSNAVERLPNAAVLHARRSSVAFLMGKLDLARAAVARQLALTPDDVEATLYAASLDLAKLDFASAEGRVIGLIAKHPKLWRAHYQLGMIYESMRLFAAARVAYRVALTNGPEAWQPRNNLAVLMLEEKGRAPEAKALFEAALALAPERELPNLRYNLALACLQLGERAQAQRLVREVAKSGASSDTVANARKLLKQLDTGVTVSAA